MVIPFVFNLSTYSETAYAWFFFKGLDMAKHGKWPIISQEIYLDTPLRKFIKDGQRAAYDKAFIDEHFWYDVPKSKDMKSYGKYPIKQEIIDGLLAETGSYNDAAKLILSKPYQPLVDLLCGYIEDIKSKYSEPIEAFCTLCHNPSLSAAAEKYGIPVVHYEMGPFREPTYMKTVYFDFQSTNTGNTVETRYGKFLSEMKNDPRLLSGKEILALLLRPEKEELLDKYGTRPDIKCGAALGYTITELFLAQTGYNDGELLYRIEKTYGRENMRVRLHPADPYGAKYPKYWDCMDPKEHSTIDFILSCDELFSVGSNVCIEAMYWGRKSHVIVRGPAYWGAVHSVEEKGKLTDTEYLNFFAFNYLAPFRFMMDPEYVRWRLTDPSEKEIFEKHISVLLSDKGLSMDILKKKSSERLQEFRKAGNVNV